MWNGKKLFEGIEGARRRAIYKANGYTDEDLLRPHIGIVNTFNEAAPGHSHMRQIAEAAKAGGAPAVMNELKDLLHLDCLTVNGTTLGENITAKKSLNRNVIDDVEHPFHETVGLVVLKGNLAPVGAIARPTSFKREMLKHPGPAKVFDSDEEALKAIYDRSIQKGDVIVIRYEKPKGAPGMREMMLSTDALVGMDLDREIALTTDGRFSDFNQGTAIGHIAPQAMAGGPIAVVRDGDIIEIDILNRSLTIRLTDDEIKIRLRRWKAPEPKVRKGVLTIYSAGFGFKHPLRN